MNSKAIERWHEIIKSNNPGGLNELLAENAVFHSPVVHTPQEGKAKTSMYLMGAMAVLGPAGFHYTREIIGEQDAVLEFEAEIDGILINGIDLIKWNENDQIVDFKVMIRPLKAVNLLHQKMGEMLQAYANKS